MAVDDNSPKTGSETTVEAPTSSCPPPETPPPASIELSGGDPGTDIQTGSSSSGAKMAAITIARGNDRIQRSGTGGRRKQCRPMRLVCSLIDAVDVGSEDDDDVIGNRPPCLNADYPDVEYRAHSPSDGATDHMDSSETDLSNHLRIRGHSNRKYTNDNTNADAISSGAPYASAKLDGDIIGFDSNSASDDVSEFPTRYHRLGNELKREMETSNARLEQQMLAINFSGSVDSFSRTTMVGLDDEFGTGSSSNNNINSNKNQLISLTGQNDIDYSGSDQAAAAAAAAAVQLNHLMRYRHFEGIAAAAAGDSSDGCAPLDFTMQHRVSANTTTTNSNNSNLSGTRHQHSAAAATSSTAISSLTESTSSRQNSSPQHQQQQSQHHHGHHHHHYHHHQQQQQQHHHKSSSSSLVNNSGVEQTSTSAGSVHQTPLPPHPPVVESEDYCDRCQKHFCNKYYLRKHRQDVHGIAPSADAAAAAAQAAAAAAQQQQAISTSNTAAATAAVQHLMQAGSSTSPVSGSGLSAAAAASALPYQPLLGSLPFVFPYQQPIGTSCATTSDGSQLFQSPPGGIISTSGSQSASVDSNTSVSSSSAAGAALPPSSLLPSLTSLMLLNPFALLNAPSFIQSQAVAAAAGLAAAARMNLTASSSLNSLAELQKSGGIAAAGGSTGTTASSGGLFNIGSVSDPDAPLSLAGLLPPFLNVSEPSSLLSPQSTQQQQQQQQMSSGTLVEDFSSSPSSSASSSTNASYQCDLCRKEFCSSYFLAMHRRDKHGIPTNAAADQPSSPSLSTASASSQVATAAALAATAAGLQLPPTALSEAIKLLSTSSVNGRSSGLDAVTAAALSAILQPDGVEPGEKVSASAGARSSSGGSAGGKMTSSSSSTPNREHNEKSSRGIFGDQFGGLSLPSSVGTQSVNGPDDVCCLCKKQFPNRYGLVLHLLSAHNVRPEGFGLAGELLQLDGLLGAAGGLLLPPPPPPPPMLSASQTPGSGSSARTSSRTAPSSGGLIGQGSSAGGSVNLSTGSGSSTLSTSSSKQSDRVSCDICNKEVCNKYFLKTHKIKVHGVYSSAAGSYVLPSPPQQQTQQQSAAGTNADVKPDLNTGSTSPVDMKSSRLSGNGGTQSTETTPVLKHEEMRKGLMLADSKLNSFAAHLDLALKKDSFGLAGLGLAGLAGLGASDSGLPPLPPLPGLNPPLSASDLFRLFSGAAGKPDDPFGIAAAAAAAAAASFGLTPSLKPQGLPDFGEQLASAAADGGRSSRSGTSSLSDMSMNLSKHSSSSSATGDRAAYYKESNHGTVKGKITSNSGSNGNSSSAGNNAGMKHSSSKDLQGTAGNSGSGASQLHLKSSSSSSSLNSSMCGVPAGTERTALTEQELIQSGIDPEAYCEICQKEFCSKYFLRTHRQKIHGVSGPSNTGSGSSSSAGDGGGNRKSSMIPAPDSMSSSGVLNSAMAFDPFRSLAAAAAASSALSGSNNPAGAMPLLPLFQGLSLPPFPFGVSPSAAGSLMLSGTDGVGGDNLLGGSGINMTSSGASQMAGGSISRPSGSREAANATRVTCEVCGKELCNKYFLKTHMAKIHGTTVGGHHQQQQQQTRESSSSSRELQQQQLQQSSSNEARQPAESGDNNLSSKLVANVAADVAARIMQHQSTVNSTSGHHDIDLLAPSAFQSLGGVVGAAASTSVSRSSPEMGNQAALAAAATGVYRSDHNGNDQQLEPSRRHDQQQHQSSRSQHHHQQQQQQVQRQLSGSESSADSAIVSGGRNSFLDSAAAAAVSHHRRRSPHEDVATVAGAELAAVDARKSNGSPGLRSSSGNNNTERREDASATKRKLCVDDQLAASDETDNESQNKVMRFDDRLMSSMPALVPLPVPVSDSSQLFRRSSDCDSTDNANFASNQNNSAAAAAALTTTGNDFLQHQLLLAKLASELQSRSASSSLAAAADFNKRLNNDEMESDSSRTSPTVASALPLSLTAHRTVLAVNGHSTSISPNNELETGTRKSLNSDNQQQPDAGIGLAMFSTASRYDDRIGSGSLSPADLTTAATQLQMFMAPQPAANDQHPVDFTAAGARTTTPQQAVE